MPAVGALKVMVSALVAPSDFLVKLVVVGALPILLYKSPSPVPPDNTNVKVDLPAGTAILYSFCALEAKDIDTAVPLVKVIAGSTITSPFKN